MQHIYFVRNHIARNRVQRFKDRASSEILEDLVPFFTLGIVLESIGKGDSRELLKPYWEWVENGEGSWLRLFFVAGMLLRDEETFPARSFHGTILRINAEPLRSQLKVLFDHYNGR